jgi:DNA-directed RNA polymerase subunit K/omega
MADSDDSEIEIPDDDSDTDVNDIDDPQLRDEVVEAINAEPEIEAIIPADINPASLNADDEDIDDEDILEDMKASVHEEPQIEEPVSDKIQFHTLGRAEDSRMPDIPSIFELAGLIISRTTMLEQNSEPLVPFARFDPYIIARAELLAGKSIRSVLRGNYVWKVSDFAYLPIGFANIDAELDAHHNVQ